MNCKNKKALKSTDISHIQKKKQAKEGRLDALQTLEKVLTEPLLITSAFACMSTTVPTEMAQKLFVLVVQVYICYRLLVEASRIESAGSVVSNWYLNLAKTILVIKTLILTSTIVMIEFVYFVESEKQGESIGGFAKGSMSFIIAYHFFMCAAHVAQVYMGREYADLFANVHFVLDFFFRAIASLLLFLAGRDRMFASPNCNLWGFS